MNHRPERVQSLIQEELGKMLIKEVEFPGFVTITSVEVDEHLNTATVMLSVIPEKSEKTALAIAKKAEKHLQHLLFKKINIRPMPQIKFEIDYGADNAAKVEKLLIEGKVGKKK